MCFTWAWSDVEVLRGPLLGRGAMLGVGAASLLRGGVVQHHGRGAVASGVVRSCNVSLQQWDTRHRQRQTEAGLAPEPMRFGPGVAGASAAGNIRFVLSIGPV